MLLIGSGRTKCYLRNSYRASSQTPARTINYDGHQIKTFVRSVFIKLLFTDVPSSPESLYCLPTGVIVWIVMIRDRGSLVTALIYIGHRGEILEVGNSVT